MKQITMSLSEYEGMKKQMEQLKKESIRNFVQREYSSLQENKYAVEVDMNKLKEYVDDKHPNYEHISFSHSSFNTVASMSSEDKLVQPLLTITLQDESSVPTVIYKGEEIEGKKSIQFDWETSDAVSMGGLTYAIEHVERNKDYPAINRIERRVRDHV